MILTLILFIIILGVLVFVHELGHFIAARKVGVTVKEFAFGFKPRIWGKKVGDTSYVINAIPLGGYVHMKGEGESESGSDSYSSQGPLAKIFILVSGVVMNFLFALVLLTVLFAVGFEPFLGGVETNPYVETLQSVRVVKIAESSPAQEVGLRSNDTITAVNGKQVNSDREFIGEIGKNKGQITTVSYIRDGKEYLASVRPRSNPPEGQGPLGVAVETSGEISTTYLKVLPAAVYETGRIASVSALGFGRFVKDLFVDQKVSEDVTGLIGVGALTGVVRRLGWEYVVQLVVVVSIGLGVVNLIPIMPLDGGQLAVVSFEAIVRRKVSEKGLNYFASLGLVLIILLFVVVTVKDFIRFDVKGRFL